MCRGLVGWLVDSNRAMLCLGLFFVFADCGCISCYFYGEGDLAGVVQHS